jgi:hypothetical protein
MLSTLILALALTPDLTGIYEVSGAPGDALVVLQERAGGELIGYLAGSPTTWIESGQAFPMGALIELQGQDGSQAEPWSVTLKLRKLGRDLTGILIQGSATLPITLTRTGVQFSDETWLWFDQATGGTQDVRRALDLGGNFLLGGFNSSSTCDFMACGGRIDSWSEVAGSHDIWTSSTGSCGQTGHLLGTFDTNSNQLDGTWDSTSCAGPAGMGTFLGGKAGSTSNKEISALLKSLALFADDFEAESLDAADVFHSTYLSDGVNRAAWTTQFSAWFANYDGIQVDISGPKEIITNIGSDVHPYLAGHPRTAWTVRATGTNVSTGLEETFWERIEPELLGPGLRLLGAENGRVVFIGNGQTQPLSIGLPILLSDVDYQTCGAWPFGQHGGGHAEDGHGGIDFEYQAGALCYAAEAGEVVEIRINLGHPPSIQWDVIQEIRPGVLLQYGHVADPPLVNIGDNLTTGAVIGSPSVMPGGSHAVIHFSLSFQGVEQGNGDQCPTPWFNAAAAADWDVIWPQSHYSQELCEPLQCNDREAAPPYTATWDLELAGSGTGPNAILFFRADGYADNYVYTFFDTTGVAYETGVTEQQSSPGTIGIKFIADGTGALTFGACDVVSDEMQLKLATSMPTDMSGAATYRYQQ